MSLKLFVFCVVAASLVHTKIGRSSSARTFEDNYERQLSDYSMNGDEFSLTDELGMGDSMGLMAEDDSGCLISGHQKSRRAC